MPEEPQITTANAAANTDRLLSELRELIPTAR